MDIKRLGILTLLACTALITSPVLAQQTGDTVVFAIPEGTDVTTGPDGDTVIFVGRSMGVVDARNCATDGTLRPLQPVVLVDAGAGNRATRSQSLVVISRNGAAVTEGFKNGTRIGNLMFDLHCSVNGVSYFRYSGIIE